MNYTLCIQMLTAYYVDNMNHSVQTLPSALAFAVLPFSQQYLLAHYCSGDKIEKN
jgi:hypothetical protein